MKTATILALSIAITFLSGCSETESAKIYGDIQAVWFHEGNNYSFTIIQDGKLVNIGPRSFENAKSEVIADVKEGEPLWAKVTHNALFGDDNNKHRGTLYEIHVHSIKDINGAGWDHGKFGSGSTSVVEKAQ